MKRLALFSYFLVVGISLTASQAEAQPEQEPAKAKEQELEVPEGFELQPLELGGQILKPVGWKYESRELGKTLATKMWEPMPDDTPGFDTSFTIDIVTNTADANMSPSEYAASYIKSLKEKGKVLKEYEPTTSGGMIQSGLLLDQKLTITGSEKEYRIRSVLFADDERELLFVVTFGTLASQWEEYEPTFRVMTKRIKLIGLSSDAKSDKESDKEPDK